jgi:hypothetical protein
VFIELRSVLITTGSFERSLANGVWGRSSVPGAAGVFGENVSGYGMVATTRGFGVGLYARGINRAGYFDGRVEIQGDLQVRGAKSAAVAHPDGSHRLLYALENPQSWFEDFGRSRISQGRARVELDSDFAALVQTTDYHVFLTPEGDSNGLYVRGRNSDSFEVCEQQGGKSDLAFTYRVVAKRKDIEVERLQRMEASPPPEPVQPPLPEELALPPHG